MNLDKLFGVFPVLETERLRLRQVVLSDVDALFKVFGDEVVMEYYGEDVPHRSAQDTYNEIARLHGYFGHRQGIRWAITLKGGDDTAFGTLGFYKFEVESKCCELGYELNRDYWRQGIMSEALRAILDYGFHEVGFNRVEAGTDDDNPRSHGLLKKIGFKHEACFRQRLFYKDKYWDEHWFGLLKTEYEQSK